MKSIQIETMKINAKEDKKSILRKCSQIFSNWDTDGSNGYEFMLPEARAYFQVPEEDDPAYDEFYEDVSTNQYWEEKFMEDPRPLVDIITAYAEEYIQTLTDEDYHGVGYRIIPEDDGILIILSTLG